MNPGVKHIIEAFDIIARQIGPYYLAYWTLQNTILTLSGARAYCDGVFWDDANRGLLKQWEGEIAKSIELIKEHFETVWADVRIEEPRPKEKFASFELITKKGLNYLLAHTDLLSD